MPLRQMVMIGELGLMAFPVQHSIKAPAVGYRVVAAAGVFFYLPDVAALPGASDVLRQVDVYIGDGATIRRSMVRKKNGSLTGHAPITAQLGWCAAANVRRAVFTHCGSPIVRGNARALDALVSQLGHEQGIDARIACDGDRLSILPNGCLWKPGKRAIGVSER
jgi:phosphoribosyl 1,2-cyclic phosphodiesterase